MSAVYALEPPTEGKAVVHTTHGELEIEFFAREAPLACRNFVQLALEGCVRSRSRAAAAETDEGRDDDAGITMRMNSRGAWPTSWRRRATRRTPDAAARAR